MLFHFLICDFFIILYYEGWIYLFWYKNQLLNKSPPEELNLNESKENFNGWKSDAHETTDKTENIGQGHQLPLVDYEIFIDCKL